MVGERRLWKTNVCKNVSKTEDLATSVSGDTIDYFSYMAEETTWQYFKRFRKDIVYMYKTRYLTRWPTAEELEYIQ